MAHIIANDLTVDYKIYTAVRSVKRSLLLARAGGSIESNVGSSVVRAINGLNLNVQAGERIGLYGHNGSGKSTLLRVLTGAFAPTNGYLEIDGTVASLIDISMGMDQDATGWENIMLRGRIMGLAGSEIEDRIGDIADFSGLGQYLDMPIRTYSSGMQVRLAFSVSTAVSPDILLLDEWLSVGDVEFQEKAKQRLQSMIERSSILVLASHSLDLLRGVCTRILHLEHGCIMRDECVC